ncbi:MAG: Ap4A phosphorylase II [Nitrospira sp.]
MADQGAQLTPGALLAALLERTEHARCSGALHTLRTTLEVIEQDGIAFQVRILGSLARKEPAAAARPNTDPFLLYDPNLFVAPISPTHIALLNKFNVVERHLLIVTRAFEDQRCQLTQKDCEAVLIALTEIDGLAFYNAGREAGASQSHKHFQLLPFDAIGPLPLEPLFRFAHPEDMVGTVPRLPFRHAYAPMDADWTNPEKVSGASFHACYRRLLHAVGLAVDAAPGSHAPAAPYNLLMTRKWALLVPRSQECVEDISINALGFAGTFLVKDRRQFETLRRIGPLTALHQVTT